MRAHIQTPETFDLENVSGSESPMSPVSPLVKKSKTLGLGRTHIAIPQTPRTRKTELAKMTGPAGNKGVGAEDVNTFLVKQGSKQACVFCMYVLFYLFYFEFFDNIFNLYLEICML